MAKPQIILEIKTYADGILVNQSAKVIEPGPDWIKRIILAVAIPLGAWLMAVGGIL
jgi:hypothetical protein